ncbi:type II secretion system protein F (GspF) [Anaerosphaera aminiphila DSM 21120]|uniref:Type II secretion system protein F (GspF) n=1 Tax=Anaerosphaera aminiphila DSM 21120 TaxID=1120995 RepID=A0A1M5RHN5_9FIRM|nr:type II secretion system F family protein [Anaerosphaera aminiphila]SHH25842.1 type II secretion system protein F (GspF) [Anaerosphaera aminiphila DSM 21120]
MIYKCKVINLAGDILEEKIETSSEDKVIEILRNKNLRPIKIEEESYSNVELKINKRVFSSKDIQILLYQLYIMTKSKIQIPKAFEILIFQNKGKKKLILEDIHRNLNRGYPLSECLSKTKAFPVLIVNMVAIGENSSDISLILHSLSEYYIGENILNKRIKNALIYPMILIAVTILIVNFLILNVMPTFIDIFKNSNANLPLSTRILIGTSNFVKDNLLILILFVLFLIIIVIVYLKTSSGKRKLDLIKLKSSYYKLIMSKKFISMMYFLTDSKLTISKSLVVIESSIDNIIIKEKIDNSISDLKRGVKFSETLFNYNIFSDIVISMIKIAEESANINEILKSLDEYLEHEIKIREEKLLALIEPVTIIILSIIIGFIIIAIAIPMFDITNRI